MKNALSLVGRTLHWLKEAVGNTLVFLFVWVLIVHGIALVVCIVVGLVALGVRDGIQYALATTLLSLVLSSPAILLGWTAEDDNLLLAYLAGGLLGGLAASGFLVIGSLFLNPTPAQAVMFVMGIAMTFAISAPLWGMREAHHKMLAN